MSSRGVKKGRKRKAPPETTRKEPEANPQPESREADASLPDPDAFSALAASITEAVQASLQGHIKKCVDDALRRELGHDWEKQDGDCATVSRAPSTWTPQYTLGGVSHCSPPAGIGQRPISLESEDLGKCPELENG